MVQFRQRQAVQVKIDCVKAVGALNLYNKLKLLGGGKLKALSCCPLQMVQSLGTDVLGV
jgi:hypothetical protein